AAGSEKKGGGQAPMNVANPAAFLLIPILVLLIALRESRWFRGIARLPFPSTSLVEGLPSTWRVRLSRLPWFLIYAGLLLSVVALARPRSLLKGAEARARGIDNMIALDTSGS